MSRPAFDAAGSVRFDLRTGTIRSAADEQLALIPADLVSLLDPGADLDRVARAWGESQGIQLAAVLARADEPTTIDTLADYLGGALTVAGLGRATIEIRGDALMFRIRPGIGAPASAGRRALLAGFLAGYLGALGPGGFGVVHLEGDAGSDLFWAGNPDAARRVQHWLEQGMAPTVALDSLAAGGAA
jgi:hypothetical protein